MIAAEARDRRAKHMTADFQEVDAALERLVSPRDEALEHALQASADAGLPPIQVAPLQGRFLELLARAVGAREVLEVGTLGGYSTIHLARGVGEEGRVTTLEIDERHAEVARANLAYAGVADRVDVLVGPALSSLEKLAANGYGPIDLLFVDADKPNNSNYLRAGLELSHPGTLLIVDNVVRGGKVVDADPDEASRGARDAIKLLASTPNVHSTVLQVVGAKGHDGLLLGIVDPRP